MRLERLLGLGTLELEGGREEVVLDAEGRDAEDNRSERLKAADLVGLADLIHVIEDHLNDGGVLDELRLVRGILVLLLLRPGNCADNQINTSLNNKY